MFMKNKELGHFLIEAVGALVLAAIPHLISFAKRKLFQES
jgi:hypothetical protein